MEQQRSRSQTKIPNSGDTSSGEKPSPLGRNVRSRSLDLRREFDDDYWDNRFARTPQPPQARNYDYDRPKFFPSDDSPRKFGDGDRDRDRDRPSPPREQGRWPNQARGEYGFRDYRDDYDRRREEYPRENFYSSRGDPYPPPKESFPPPQQLTPSPPRFKNGGAQNTPRRVNEKSSGSRSKSAFSFGRRKEKPSPRGGPEYPPEDPRDPRYRRDEWAGVEGPGGGGHHQGATYHHNYHHERHAGHSSGTLPRRLLYPGESYQQGGFFTQEKYRGGLQPYRRQHYKIHCCCLSFYWPPWSMEPVDPPQPMYRNI